MAIGRPRCSRDQFPVVALVYLYAELEFFAGSRIDDCISVYGSTAPAVLLRGAVQSGIFQKCSSSLASKQIHQLTRQQLLF